MDDKLQDDKKYQIYLDERKLLIDAEREGARTFDKALLTLASGSFGFTLAFLNVLVPEPVNSSKYYLLISWILFALSIVSILLSFLTSQKSCREQIDISYDIIVKGLNDKKGNKWGKYTDILNLLAISFLILAFVFWGIFIFINI